MVRAGTVRGAVVSHPHVMPESNFGLCEECSEVPVSADGEQSMASGCICEDCSMLSLSADGSQSIASGSVN